MLLDCGVEVSIVGGGVAAKVVVQVQQERGTRTFGRMSVLSVVVGQW